MSAVRAAPPPRPSSLAALARIAAPHAAAACAVRRTGRVQAADLAEARVGTLGDWLAPGDSVVLSREGEALGLGTVRSVRHGGASIAIDRPGIRVADAVEAVRLPRGIDGAWLGRTVDARGRTLHAHPRALAISPRERVPTGDGIARTGVGVIDALLPVRFGESWRIIGPSGSGRSLLLRDIAGGEWDAVVHCALGRRVREDAPSPANALTVLTRPSAGPAECVLAMRLAVAAVGALGASHPRCVLLVDGAERLPGFVPLRTDATTFVAMRGVPGEDTCDAHDGTVALADTDAGSPIDLVASLRSAPMLSDDPLAHRLRARLIRGEMTGALRDRLNAANGPLAPEEALRLLGGDPGGRE